MSKGEVILSVNHITKKYDENAVLEDFSLSIHEGEVVVIVGPSGCGKSTILRIMNGLESVQSGEVTYRGEKVDEKLGSITRIREKVGMVFQAMNCFRIKPFCRISCWPPCWYKNETKKR